MKNAQLTQTCPGTTTLPCCVDAFMTPGLPWLGIEFRASGRDSYSLAAVTFKTKHLCVFVLLSTLTSLPAHHGYRLSVHPHPLLLLHHPRTQGTNTSSCHCHAWHHATHVHRHSNHAHALTCAIRCSHVLLRPPWLWCSESPWREEPLCRLLVLRSHSRRHEVASHAHLLHPRHLLHALHSHACHPLDVLTCQVSLPVLLSLSQCHIQGLGHDNFAIHLRHSFRCFFRCRKAYEAKTLKEVR